MSGVGSCSNMFSEVVASLRSLARIQPFWTKVSLPSGRTSLTVAWRSTSGVDDFTQRLTAPAADCGRVAAERRRDVGDGGARRGLHPVPFPLGRVTPQPARARVARVVRQRRGVRVRGVGVAPVGRCRFFIECAFRPEIPRASRRAGDRERRERLFERRGRGCRASCCRSARFPRRCRTAPEPPAAP